MEDSDLHKISKNYVFALPVHQYTPVTAYLGSSWCEQSTHVVSIIMVWWFIYPSNWHFTDWRGLLIFIQLSLEFVTEVMFVPSVYQKIL